MPFLPDLPTEILLQIMKYLLPDDVDNFCRAREGFDAIATGLLPKHEQLKSNYTEVTFGNTVPKAFHPLSLLRDVCKDPEVVWYVKVMHIEACTDKYDYEYPNVWDEARNIAVECKNGVSKLVRHCPYLDVEEREHWIDQILSCMPNTAVALLACILPCLEGISFTDTYENEKIQHMVRKIKQANNIDPGGSHALGKLEWVREESESTDVFVHMDYFEPFSALPSIRRYRGQHLAQTTNFRRSKQKSTISTLELSKSMIHTATLRSVFSRIANLRIFKYEYYWAWEGPDSESQWCSGQRDWQPGQIVLGLLKFAKHSLVELDLTRYGSNELQLAEEARDPMRWGLEGENDVDGDGEYTELPGPVNLYMGSLRRFQVLKYIRVQNEAFVEEDPKFPALGRKVYRLVDLLPASVVRVTLALPRLCPRESRRLIEGLPELKAKRVPKLEKVIAESSRFYERAESVYEVGGIKFSGSMPGIERQIVRMINTRRTLEGLLRT